MTVCLAALLTFVAGSAFCPEDAKMVSPDLILVKGGTYLMGDAFGDGNENERPVHQVTLSDFYIGKYEVTVGQFREFVVEAGYRTSAEAPVDSAAYKRLMERYASGKLTSDEKKQLRVEMLRFGGSGYWHPQDCKWIGYKSGITWRNPGFEQTDSCPVVSVSLDDAMHYLNWLSVKVGLSVAYDLTTGETLDSTGKPTLDITKIRGLRLPTEAEWEYAARDRGTKVRFGNGADIAQSTAINFRASSGDFSYLERGEYRKRTTPVGSFAPNKLGLFDMSGNAWEWTGGQFLQYSDKSLTDPNALGDMHALRGGRWGGDAFEARVFHRSAWHRSDRCNNSGFRMARSR